jgi:hypothetical protein
MRNELLFASLSFSCDNTFSNYRSRLSTPRFSYKKRHRPPTKFVKKRVTEVEEGNHSLSTDSSRDNKSTAKVAAHISKNIKSTLHKKPENLLDFDCPTSGLSSDAGLDVGGNHHARLNSVIDKLQDHDW